MEPARLTPARPCRAGPAGPQLLDEVRGPQPELQGTSQSQDASQACRGLARPKHLSVAQVWRLGKVSPPQAVSCQPVGSQSSAFWLAEVQGYSWLWTSAWFGGRPQTCVGRGRWWEGLAGLLCGSVGGRTSPGKSETFRLCDRRGAHS